MAGPRVAQGVKVGLICGQGETSADPLLPAPHRGREAWPNTAVGGGAGMRGQSTVSGAGALCVGTSSPEGELGATGGSEGRLHTRRSL